MMIHLLVIILVPLLATAPISVMTATVRTRAAVFFWFSTYIAVTCFGPFAYGWYAMPRIREDWTEILSLAGLIGLQRSIEWWGLDLRTLFKEKWNDCR